MNEEYLWKALKYCDSNRNKPDLHSFVVNIKNGIAFVEVREYGEVFIETKTQSDGDNEEKTTQWCGTLIAACNRLEMLGANHETISM